jgi:hypothetical protein
MERSLRLTASGGTTRPRGAHRFEVFSPKLSRRLTFYRRPMLDEWVPHCHYAWSRNAMRCAFFIGRLPDIENLQ